MMNIKKILKISFVAALIAVAVPGLALATGQLKLHGHSNQSTVAADPNVTPVNGTFRTPPGDASECFDTPDCQIDWFFGDIGGEDSNHRVGADDRLNTIFINEDDFFGRHAPGYWTYRDREEITDARGVFRGFEDGVIDARPAQSNTGGFWGHYIGLTDDNCWKLEFNITGIIDLTGIIDQSQNPVNADSGVWAGKITKLCN